MTTSAPISKVQALASIAYISLAARGNHHDPTLHDITCAVVRAAPLLDIVALPEAVDMEIEAIKTMCERHNWQDKKIVVLDHAHAERIRSISQPK